MDANVSLTNVVSGNVTNDRDISLLTLTDAGTNAKKTFLDIFNVQLLVIQNVSNGTSFFLPTVGLVDPKKPEDIAKIEFFTEFNNLRSDVMSQALNTFKSIEDSTASALK